MSIYVSSPHFLPSIFYTVCQKRVYLLVRVPIVWFGYQADNY